MTIRSSVRTASSKRRPARSTFPSRRRRCGSPCAGSLDLAELADDPDFKDNTNRLRNRDALRSRLNTAFSRESQETWTERLVSAGIPAGPIYRIDQLFKDPHIKSGGFVEHAMHPLLGDLPLMSFPAKLGSMSRGSIRRPPPLLGEHSIEVLGEFGVSAVRIEDLVRQQAVSARGETNVR